MRISDWSSDVCSSDLVVEAYAKRLQIQEKMTSQIANTIDDVLKPKGVAVVIEATHHCMTTRGVHKPGTSMITSRMLGMFRTTPSTRREFLYLAGTPGNLAPGRSEERRVGNEGVSKWRSRGREVT